MPKTFNFNLFRETRVHHGRADNFFFRSSAIWTLQDYFGMCRSALWDEAIIYF